MAYQFKVLLESTKPPVWRRLMIPKNFTFIDLHAVIQAAMGWENAHLFAFRHPDKHHGEIGIPADSDWGGHQAQDAQLVYVREVFTHEKQRMHYEYDFGDSWQHTVLLEKILDDRILAPQCLKGKGACPPEDCGGLWGYYSMVETVNDPKASDHQDMREWIGMKEGERWDLEAFDIDECRRRVTHYQEWSFDF